MHLPAIPIPTSLPIAVPVEAAAPSSPPILPLWHALREQFQAVRPVAITVDGEPYPETTAGDVRLASVHLSRALCHARYDHARLTEVRAAWRDALARVAATLARVGWDGHYPDNRGFWLDDARALAQQLGAVDARRNGITAVDGRPRVAGTYRDLSVLLDDLRHWYLERRFVRRSRGLRYPETTVGDVREVAAMLSQHAGVDPARSFDERVASVSGRLFTAAIQDGGQASSPRRARWHQAVAAWRAALARIDGLAGERSDDATYPDNPRFWLVDAHRFAAEIRAIERATREGR